jgi:hypothetical protein
VVPLKSKAVLILLISIFVLSNCGKSETLVVIPEPVVDQVSIVSPEICLKSFLWVFPSNPCFWIKGEKDNTTLLTKTSIVFNLSSFDVEFPLGLSLKLDSTFHNLVKQGTEYGSNLQLISEISDADALSIAKASEISLSYTNRKETQNYSLSSSKVSEFKENLAKIKDLLKSEPKLKIVK